MRVLPWPGEMPAQPAFVVQALRHCEGIAHEIERARERELLRGHLRE